MAAFRLPLRAPAFVSLQWKAIAATAAVLLFVTGLYAGRDWRDSGKRFRQERALVRSRCVAEVRGLIHGSLQRLQQVAATVPSLSGVGSALQTRDVGKIRRAFDAHWTMLQINMGLDVARLYDAEGKLLGAWGQAGLWEPVAPTPATVAQVLASGGASRGIESGPDCMEYAAVPLVEGGVRRGIVLLGASLADVIVGFKSFSGADIALVVDKSLSQPQTDRSVEPWGHFVAAATELAQTLEILREAAQRHPNLEDLLTPSQVTYRDRQYDVMLVPVSELGADARAHLLVVSDVTEALFQAKYGAWARLGVGIVAAVLAECALLLLLGPSMRRLSTLVESLPLLANGGFEEVRSIVGKTAPGKGTIRDEVDVLGDATTELSWQLERLEAAVRDRTAAVRSQLLALEKNNNFVTTILDTAPVVMLTQNSEGRVMLVNDFGRKLLHYRARSPVKPFFWELLKTGSDGSDQLRLRLRELAAAERTRFEHESVVLEEDGGDRNIAWIHTRLPNPDKEEETVLSIGMDVTARKQAESRIAWFSDHDALTGLFNRKRFSEELDEAIASAQRYGRTGAVIIVDIDQFGYINETKGPQFGDLLLNIVARNLSRVIRSVDLLARLGPDEFGILLRETDEAGTTELAKKLGAEVHRIVVPYEGVRHPVKASIGAALFPAHANTVRDVLGAAEAALEQAQEQTTSRWCLYSEKVGARQMRHLGVFWKNRIEQALAEGLFRVHYQPILHMASRTVTHYEALVRMVERDGTLILPGQFIPWCEKLGLVNVVDRTVLGKVIDQLGALADVVPDVRISANISANAFEDSSFLGELRHMLGEREVAPQRLILEVTETAAVTDFAAARAMMEEIRALGCSLAIDDFGVGSASLAYLKELPVDYVKIDGSFVRKVCEDPSDQILMSVIVMAARGFGKQTIAECVESETVLNALDRYGIDFAQGYHVGKPRPPEEVFPKFGLRPLEPRPKAQPPEAEDPLSDSEEPEGYELLIL